jgi:hypothetical protein
MDNNLKKIICRKCGGNHFTVKCGKDQLKENTSKDQLKENTSKDQLKENTSKDQLKDNYKTRFSDTPKKYNKPKYEYKQKYNVQIANLPNDITEEELMELTSNWGNISKIKVVKHSENVNAYIDFLYEDQAKYFVKALNKTPFDNLYLSVILNTN